MCINNNNINIKFSSLILIISALFLFGCSSSTRFGKEDSESKEKYDDENFAILETVDGVASYYSEEFHGRKTANGETYDMYGLTAAHKTYPFNTEVRITNISNGKSVELRINDRMPHYNKRMIDISFQAAREIDMIISGIADVKIEVLEWGE
ncbi:MAG: septal ring lytic transglycosylase RlpA family protein [Ignavibacteriales bacterium]|nr:MAG: septal ring lytic transglycosylase RlpA family protein [Ignavibacteriales bacterium]